MKRGEVYWVDFDPAIGGEISKTRPAVVVSNTDANQSLNRVIVIPLTGNVSKLYPSEALVICKGRSSKAIADQLTVASKQRFGAYICTVTADEMKLIEAAIAYHLDLLTWYS
jgi:mRNA interferase MazF